MKNTNITKIRIEKAKKTRTRNQAKSNNRLRLTVYRSNQSLFAQIINDQKGITLVGVHSKSSEKGKTKTDQASELGKILAQKALEKKIDTVYFDRGHYKFHGRIKALAESARATGLKF